MKSELVPRHASNGDLMMGIVVGLATPIGTVGFGAVHVGVAIPVRPVSRNRYMALIRAPGIAEAINPVDHAWLSDDSSTTEKPATNLSSASRE